MSSFDFDNTPITSDIVLVPLFTPTTTTYCPADNGFQATLYGQTASKTCTSGEGKITRLCTSNGWGIADESACINSEESSNGSNLTLDSIPTNYMIYGGIGIGVLLLLLLLL